mmetsp:Transcript_19348/g.50757  ORF Transcript_19348/g.50757 Transcript_19348/m.50757 type:complete len:277 (-) Transcript_19348:384-1214(-)
MVLLKLFSLFHLIHRLPKDEVLAVVLTLQVLHKEEEVHVGVQDDLEVHRHDLSVLELNGRDLTYGRPKRTRIRGATPARGATTPTRNHHPNTAFPRPLEISGAVRLMKVLPGGWQLAQLQRTPYIFNAQVFCHGGGRHVHGGGSSSSVPGLLCRHISTAWPCTLAQLRASSVFRCLPSLRSSQGDGVTLRIIPPWCEHAISCLLCYRRLRVLIFIITITLRITLVITAIQQVRFGEHVHDVPVIFRAKLGVFFPQVRSPPRVRIASFHFLRLSRFC